MENAGKQLTNLCFIIKNSQVLLGMKKRGFGEGYWNGFGGKLLPGESMRESMRREVKEESGIEVLEDEQVGILNFSFTNGLRIECHFFKCTDFEGEPGETDEMRPQWFYFNEIPFDKMWPDDRYWFPYLLDGKKFSGSFEFDDKHYMLDYEVTETDEQWI